MILIALKQEMIVNKKAAQPADGEMYWWRTVHLIWHMEGQRPIEQKQEIH